MPLIVAVGQLGRHVLEHLRRVGAEGFECVSIAPGERLPPGPDAEQAVLVADADRMGEPLAPLWKELRKRTSGRVAMALVSSGQLPPWPECVVVRPGAADAQAIALMLPWLLDPLAKLPTVPLAASVWRFDLRPERPRRACAARLVACVGRQLLEARSSESRPLAAFLGQAPAWQAAFRGEAPAPDPFLPLAEAVGAGRLQARHAAAAARTAMAEALDARPAADLATELDAGLCRALAAGGFAEIHRLLADLSAQVHDLDDRRIDRPPFRETLEPIMFELERVAGRRWLGPGRKAGAVLSALEALSARWPATLPCEVPPGELYGLLESRWERLAGLEEAIADLQVSEEVPLEEYLAALPEGEEVAAAALIARAQADRALVSPDLPGYLLSHAASRFTWVADRPISERLDDLASVLATEAAGTLVVAVPGDLTAAAALDLARRIAPGSTPPITVPLESAHEVRVIRLVPDPETAPPSAAAPALDEPQLPAIEVSESPGADPGIGFEGRSTSASELGERWRAMVAEFDALVALRRDQTRGVEELAPWRLASLPGARNPRLEAAEIVACALATGAIAHTNGTLSYAWREDNGLIGRIELAPIEDPARAISTLMEYPALKANLRADVRSRLGDPARHERAQGVFSELVRSVSGKDWLGLAVTDDERLLATAADAAAQRLPERIGSGEP